MRRPIASRCLFALAEIAFLGGVLRNPSPGMPFVSLLISCPLPLSLVLFYLGG
jgi:hypothetical protein